MWKTVEDGDFFCPGCGGDRNYELRVGRRRLAVLRMPVLPRGKSGPVVACSSCLSHFAPEVLQQPTTTRLGSMLRTAVHAVALTVLTAGGAESPTVRTTAVGWLRTAGFASCDEERLLTLLAAFQAECASSILDPAKTEPPASEIVGEAELRAALTPLTPHLSLSGREGLLLEGARVALADGPYESAELAVLDVVGEALLLSAVDVERLLAAAPELS